MGYTKNGDIESLECSECKLIDNEKCTCFRTDYKCKECSGDLVLIFDDGTNVRRVFASEVEAGDIMHIDCDSYLVLGVKSSTCKNQESVAIGLKGHGQINILEDELVDVTYNTPIYY